MYGQSGVRGIVQTRALSLSLYFLSLVVGIVVIPLVVIGPSWLGGPAARVGRLPHLPLLARGDRPRGGQHRDAVPHLDARAGRPGCATCPGRVLTLVIWVRRVVRPARHHHRVRRRRTSIYGPLSDADRAADLPLRPRHRGAHRAALNAAIRKHLAGRGAAVVRAQAMSCCGHASPAERRPKARRPRPATPSGLRRLGRGGAPTRGTTTPTTSSSVKALRDEAPKPLTPHAGVRNRHGRHPIWRRRTMIG